VQADRPADAHGMSFRASGAVRASSVGVISAALLLTCASIWGVTTLQQRAGSSDDAQIELTRVQRDFGNLQSLPYNVIGVTDRALLTQIRQQIEGSERQIKTTIARLRREALTPHLVTVVAPFNASVALIEQVRQLLIAGQSHRADLLAPRIAVLQTRVDRQLALAGADYERRAGRSERFSLLGSAGMILTLFTLFGVFYLRSRQARANAERLAEENAQLLLHDAQLQVIQRLALAAEYRDDETGQHTRRVGDLSMRIGEALELPEEQLLLLGRAAPLHDVGKISIADNILLKPGPLTRQEFEEMKTHTTVGAAMLTGRSFPLLAMAEEIALSHHERWDGSGYPAGTSGAATPLAGRIVAVADVYDALTHSRPYKAAWTAAEAVSEIKRQRGSQFDPKIVDAFLVALGDFADAPDGKSSVAGTTPRLRPLLAA
jgi:HD-GYP domain-containing protein (c-di-GMP phosphodiesterase class II)